MPHKPLTIYKLIILYMLDKVNFPLTGAQISEFILEKEYTNFLTLQQAISELCQASMITAQAAGNRTYLTLTREGSSALAFFENNISETIKEEIADFFREHEIAMRNEAAILADYYKTTNGEYQAHLIAREKNTTLVELTLSVPTEEAAAAICDNWQRKNQDIYQYLAQQLF